MIISFRSNIFFFWSNNSSHEESYLGKVGNGYNKGREKTNRTERCGPVLKELTLPTTQGSSTHPQNTRAGPITTLVSIKHLRRNRIQKCQGKWWKLGRLHRETIVHPVVNFQRNLWRGAHQQGTTGLPKGGLKPCRGGTGWEKRLHKYCL